MNDIVLNKKESIERCISQIRTYYALPSAIPFAEDFLKQDAIAINLQRACEQCIDLANHTIKSRKLGLPKDSKESFSLLALAAGQGYSIRSCPAARRDGRFQEYPRA